MTIRAGLAPTSNNRRTATLFAILILVTGFLLGSFAFVGDQVPGISGTLIQAVTSTGFTWGFCAILVGSVAARPVAAPVVAAAALLFAVVIYYSLHLAVGGRWRLGVLEDGGSASMAGLLSVANAASFWAVGSVLAGGVLGFLGYLIQHGTGVQASASAGATLGLLSAQGWHTLVLDRGWHTFDSYGVSAAISLTSTIVLSFIGIISVFARRRLPKSWPVMWISSGVAILAGVALWHQIVSIAVSF